MTCTAPMATREALVRIVEVLDRVDPDRGGLADDQRLELVQLAGSVAGRVEALRCALVAEADAAAASMRARGTPTTSWLAVTGRLSKKESAGLLFRAKAVTADPVVQREALAGRVGVEQARSITRVLTDLPDTLSAAQRQQAVDVLVGHARRVDAPGLAQLTSQVLTQVAPEVAEEEEAHRLTREAETAVRDRGLWFVRDRGHVRFRGSLPIADGEGWVAIIDAQVESQRRTAIEVRDPLAETLTPEQRRADALAAMIRAHQRARIAPSGGGDRPRIVVTLDYDSLTRRARVAGLLGGQRIDSGRMDELWRGADTTADRPVGIGPAEGRGGADTTADQPVGIGPAEGRGGAALPTCESIDRPAGGAGPTSQVSDRAACGPTLTPRVGATPGAHLLQGAGPSAAGPLMGRGRLASGQQISPGELRRLCCDADLIPIVLGSQSEVLDVGRLHRLVTRPIRTALTHRDQGCVFPGCETHPTACEAHHLIPWWAGGPTRLENLVLLCHHHHRLVEPDPYGQRDQWQVRIGPDGIPECLPPRRLDPSRAPLRHQRFLLARSDGGPARAAPEGDAAGVIGGVPEAPDP